METRKEPTKRRLSVKYCKVDIVQRHIADPHKLHGTEERSMPVMVGVCYTGAVTKAALGFSGLPISANGWGGGLSSGWSSYSRRELPQRSDSHGAVTAWASTQKHRTKSQRHRSQVLPGPPWKGRGQWVASGYTSPECTLDGSQPPSFPDSTFAIPCGDKGTAAVPLDLLLLALSATQRQTPGKGGSWEDSLPPALISSARGKSTAEGFFSPSWLPFLWPEQGRWTRQENKPKGYRSF